jgi:lactoylglutathione lyase
MRFSCSTFFVADVERTVAFYEAAFGFTVHRMDPTYGELETGSTRLSFLSEGLLRKTKILGELAPQQNRIDMAPPGAMIVLGTDDIERDWARALAAGATVIQAPELKPWGETAGYLRDLNGLIVELVVPRSP